VINAMKNGFVWKTTRLSATTNSITYQFTDSAALWPQRFYQVRKP
jgi:hypothetical protein